MIQHGAGLNYTLISLTRLAVSLECYECGFAGAFADLIGPALTGRLPNNIAHSGHLRSHASNFYMSVDSQLRHICLWSAHMGADNCL